MRGGPRGFALLGAMQLVVGGCVSLPGAMSAPGALGIVHEATEVLTSTRGIEHLEVVYDDTASVPERIELSGLIESVPENVRAAARAGGAAPTRARWVFDAEGLAVYRFDVADGAGRACHIVIDGEAELIETECVLGDGEALPAPVQATADRLAAGPRLYAARRQTTAEESFVVHLRPTDRVQVLEIASDGTLLEHRVRFEATIELPYYGEPADVTDSEP